MILVEIIINTRFITKEKLNNQEYKNLHNSLQWIKKNNINRTFDYEFYNNLTIESLYNNIDAFMKNV